MRTTMAELGTGMELQQGREAYGTRRWLDAFELLSRADRVSPLEPSDLELLATAAAMVGRMHDYRTLLERLHQASLDAGDALAAARHAGWLGMNLAIAGEGGQAAGWFGRAQRLVDRTGGDSVERGYVLLPAAFRAFAAGDFDETHAAAAEATQIAERFDDADLWVLATHFRGMALIAAGRVNEGLTLFDEPMLAVMAGEVSPLVSGLVYCGVIASCEEAFDLPRASEWTSALTRWCAEQPQLVSFTGRCLAHRAGIMQLHGRWREALEEARVARERCERAMNRRAAGEALYREGEVHRLRGDLAAAETAYRDANRYGREPQPGLALLRFAQGDVGAAAAAIRRALDETADALKRAVLLPPFVEIMRASGEADAARAGCLELTKTAVGVESAMLRATAAHVRGAVELDEGNPRAALTSLRSAWQLWHELETPYEAARTRVLLGLACRAVGDEDTAALELDAARAAFEELGAIPDIAHVESLLRPAAPPETHGLSARELEVLRLVARGKSNKEIAAALVVSEHTVARHLQNIFRKLGVSSRTAASAYAFEHHLV